MMTITPEDVKAGFAIDVDDSVIQMYIDVIAESQECMIKKGVPVGTGKLLQVLAVRHLLLQGLNEGRGAVKSESAPSGASRSFVGDGKGQLNLLTQMDKWGCVSRLISQPGARAGFWVVG